MDIGNEEGGEIGVLNTGCRTGWGGYEDQSLPGINLYYVMEVLRGLGRREMAKQHLLSTSLTQSPSLRLKHCPRKVGVEDPWIKVTASFLHSLISNNMDLFPWGMLYSQRFGLDRPGDEGVERGSWQLLWAHKQTLNKVVREGLLVA